MNTIRITFNSGRFVEVQLPPDNQTKGDIQPVTIRFMSADLSPNEWVAIHNFESNCYIMGNWTALGHLVKANHILNVGRPLIIV